VGPPHEKGRVSRALVLCTNPVFGLCIVRSLGAIGATAHVMSTVRVSRTLFSRYCERYVAVTDDGTRSKDGVVERINTYCERHGIDVVIAGDMAATLFVAEARPSLRVPVFPVSGAELLRRLHDKWRFHELLVSLGLPTPRAHMLAPGASLDSTDLRYPLMAKPTNSEGCDRVARYDSRAELETMLAGKGAREQPWLLQEYVPGRDIDLSLIAEHGRVVAWTIQEVAEDGLKIFRFDPRLLDAGERVVAATGFHGVAHFDMRIDERDGGLAVIECNPRFWGSLILSTWSGVNFVELGCAMALNGPIRPSRQIDGPARFQGPAPRRMLKALLDGRTAPEGLSASMLAGWRQVHSDPLPELIGVGAENLARKLAGTTRT
jgi:predicted ATP-grasp superfamily ATP-dependent carboligase